MAFFFGLAVVGFAADWFTKRWAFAEFFPGDRPSEPYWLVDGVFGIQTLTNPGALFGMGSGYSHVFAAFSVFALLLIGAWMFFAAGYADRWLTIGLGLITGGILGNLYDRLGLGWPAHFSQEMRYDVRDWILFRLQGVPMFDPWPNFNIADSLLVCGAVLLLVRAIWGEPKTPQHQHRAEGLENDSDAEPKVDKRSSDSPACCK